MHEEGFAVTKCVVPAHHKWTPEDPKVFVSEITLYAGDVFRGLSNKEAHEAFSSTVILGFSRATKTGNVYAKVARPYAYASSIGSTGPEPLLGVEVYVVLVQDIANYWTRIDTNRVMGGFDTIEKHAV